MAAGTSDGQSRRRTSKSEKRGKPVPAGPGTLPTLFWRLVDLGFMLFFVLATLGGLFGKSPVPCGSVGLLRAAVLLGGNPML